MDQEKVHFLARFEKEIKAWKYQRLHVTHFKLLNKEKSTDLDIEMTKILMHEIKERRNAKRKESTH